MKREVAIVDGGGRRSPARAIFTMMGSGSGLKSHGVAEHCCIDVLCCMNDDDESDGGDIFVGVNKEDRECNGPPESGRDSKSSCFSGDGVVIDSGVSDSVVSGGWGDGEGCGVGDSRTCVPGDCGGVSGVASEVGVDDSVDVTDGFGVDGDGNVNAEGDGEGCGVGDSATCPCRGSTYTKLAVGRE